MPGTSPVDRRAVALFAVLAVLALGGLLGGCGAGTPRPGPAAHGLTSGQRSALLIQVNRAFAAAHTDPAAVASDLDGLAAEVRRMRTTGALGSALADEMLAQIAAARAQAAGATFAARETTLTPTTPVTPATPTAPAAATSVTAPQPAPHHADEPQKPPKHHPDHGNGNGNGNGDGGGDGGD